MALTQLKQYKSSSDTKREKALSLYSGLLEQLKKHNLSVEAEDFVNKSTAELNALSLEEISAKTVNKAYASALKHLEKTMKLVPKHQYRNTWMAIGVAAFGVPLGTTFGVSLDNMGLIGIGMPIGLLIGVAIGSQMDEKAKKEGRQLDVESTF